MTLPLTPISANTNTFGDWLFKTNQMLDAFSANVVTNSGTINGEVKINGSLESGNVYVTTIYGGEIGNTAPLEIASNTVLSANVSFTGDTVTLGVLSRYLTSGANTSHFVLAANAATGRLRFVNAPVLGVTNDGNFTVTDFVQANTVYTVNISGGTSSVANTLNVISEVEVSNNVTITGTLDVDGAVTLDTTFTVSGNVVVNNDTFSVDTNTLSLAANNANLQFTTLALTVSNLEFVDTSVLVSNTTMTFSSDSDLIIDGLTGPTNVRDSINTLKQEVISFAIALG